MKRFATLFNFCAALVLLTSSAFATTYYSRFSNGFVYDPSYWSTLPNGSGSFPPNFTSGDTFIIQSGHLYQTSGNNWTISGPGAKLIIESTGILSLSLPSTVTVPECFVANTGQIYIQSTGVLTIGNGNAGGYDLVVEGSLENAGAMNYSGGGTGVISPAGQYQHNIDGDTIPAFTWAQYSKAYINGIVNATSMAGLNQNFWELNWGSSSQVSNFQCNSQLTNVHILTVVTTGTGSLVLFNSTSNLDLSGFAQWAGTVNFSTTSTVHPTITFKGDSVFRQIGAGSLLCSGAGSTGTLRFDSGMTGVEIYGTIGAGVKYQLLSGARVEMQNAIPVPTEFRIDSNATLDATVNQFTLSGTGNFILNAGGTLRITNVNGITTSPTLSGEVQVTGSRIFNSGANYVYVGAPSAPGNGLPATVAKFQAVGCLLTLSNSLTVTDSFTVISATVDIGPNDLTLSGEVGSDASGKITSADNGTVSYLKTSSGQKILTNLSQYGNLTFNNYSKNLPAGTLLISNVFSPGSANPVVNGSNVIEFNGTGTQPIPGFRYAELNISKPSGDAVFPNSSTDTVHISGTFTSGPFPTYTTTGSTVEFNSTTVSQHTGYLDYHNLVLRNTYAKVTIGATITVNGMLDVGGQGLSLGATNNDNASEVVVRAGAAIDLWHPNAVLTVNDGNGGGYDLIVDGTIENKGTLQYGGGATGLVNGIYRENRDGGTIPEFTWADSSTIEILGIVSATTLGGLNQSFYNFYYYSPGQNSALDFSSQLTNVAGTFDIQHTGTGSIVLFNTDSKLSVGKFNGLFGTLNFSSSSGAQDTLEITGSVGPTDFGTAFTALTITGGGGAHGVIHFAGSNQSAYISGNVSSDIELLVSKKLTFPSMTNVDGPVIVASGGILNKSTLVGSGSFELKAGGTIVIDDADGITESGATGNIRMTGSRTFSTGGRYIYENSVPQNTGNGLPPVVSVLSQKNSSSITLSRSVTVADTLFFDDQFGMLNINTDTLSIGGATVGYVENLGAGSGTVIYSSTADGQGVIPTTYFNLLFSDHSKNLNAGTYTVSNIFSPGTVTDHTIASGSTFVFDGTSSVNVPPLRYGNLTINGNRDINDVTFSNTDSTFISGALTLNATFAGGGYQTAGSKIVFNGSSGQSIPDLDFSTLIIDKADGSATATADITITDNIVLLNGTFNDNGFIITVNGNIEGSLGQHITGSEGGKIQLAGGSLQHTISDVDLGVLELDDVYGAATTAAPGVQELILVFGTLDITNGLYILDAGTLYGAGGGITSTGFINFNGSGTVTGSFTFNDMTLNGAVSFQAGSTVLGMLQLNNGGYITSNELTYGAGSTLRYNEGAVVGRGMEWNSQSGPGYPYNVEVTNNTTLDLGANGGDATNWVTGNDLTVASGSILSLNGDGHEMTAPLTVNGKVLNEGELILSSVAGGYLDVKGDFEQNGTLTPNLSAVRFSGTSPQTILKTGGGYIYFDSLVIASADSVVLRFSNSNNLGINNVLRLESGIFFPEGASINFANNAVLEVTGGLLVPTNHVLNFSGSGSITGIVDAWIVATSGPLDPGTDLTVMNQLVLNTGGSIVSNSPFYDNASTLIYASGGNFNRYFEWNDVSGAGYPANVQIQNNTTLKLGANLGMTTPRSMSGSLTIDAGSTLSMNAIESGMTEAFTVGGSITNNGSLILSLDPGGDLNVGGDWSGTGSFNSNGRLVTFTGTAQSLTGELVFTDVAITGSGSTLTLNDNITVDGVLDLIDGFIVTGADTLTVTSAGSVSYSSGYVKGNLRKEIPATDGTISFEVGDAAYYTPVDITLSSVTTPGLLTVSSSTTGPDLTGSNIDPSKNLNRFWSIGNNGVTFGNSQVSFNYNAAEVDGGADHNSFVIRRHDGALWNTVSRSGWSSSTFVADPLSDFGTFAYGALVTNDITATAMTAGGTITPSGITSVPYDGNQSYTITPDVGFNVHHVDVDAANLGALLSYDFLNVTAPHTIEAYFTPVVCTLDVFVAGPGFSSPSTAQINYGTDQRFFFTADPGYHIDSVLVGGVKTDSLASYTILSATSSQTIYVYISQNYAVTFQVDMRPAIQRGIFVPSTDSIVLRGSIAPLQWGGTAFLMSDGNNDSIYTLTTDLYAVDSLFYKYVLIHRGLQMWERETPVNQNRIHVLTESETLPVVIFDDLLPYTPLLGTYSGDASTNVLLHLDEDPTTGSTNYSVNGFPAFDQSKSGNHGYRKVNAPGVSGRFGNGYALGDTDHVIAIQDDAALHSPNITVEGWYKFTSNTGNKVLAAKTFGSGMTNSFIIYYNNGTLFAGSGAAAGMGPILSALWTPDPGTWYHIAYTFDDNNDAHHLYVNGVMFASGTNTGSIDYDTHPVLIGAEHENEVIASHFDGTADEVRISSSVRTPYEFNLQLPPIEVATVVTDTVVDLSWSNGGGSVPASRYRIYRGTDSTTMALIDSSYTTGFSETLPNGPSIYYYRTTTVDSTGFESMKSFAVADTVLDVVGPAAPASLSALAQDGQVQVSWSPSASTDFKKYYIYGGTVPNPSSLIDSTFVVDDTVKIYSGLTNYTTYYYRVAVADTNGNIGSFSSDVSGTPFDQTAPSAPTSLNAVAHIGSVDLNWDASAAPDFLKYYVYGGSSPNPTMKVDSLFMSYMTSTTITGLSNYTNYYYRVTTVDLNGNESGYSNEVSAMPFGDSSFTRMEFIYAYQPNGTPDLVNGVSVKHGTIYSTKSSPVLNPSRTGFTFSNDSQTNIMADLYLFNETPFFNSLFANNGVGGIYDLGFTSFNSITTAPTFPSGYLTNAIPAVPGKSYAVVTLDGASYAKIQITRIDTVSVIGKPAAPFMFGITGGDGQISTRWYPNEEYDVTKYRIYSGPDANTMTLLDSTTSRSDTSKIITGLANYLLKQYRIAAVDQDGNESSLSDPTAGMPVDQTPPAIPQNLAAIAGDGQVTIHWNPNAESDFKNYYIYQGTTPNPTMLFDSSFSITDTLKIYEGMTNGQTVYFRVAAKDTNGNTGAYSADASATPHDMTPPDAPLNLAAQAGDGSVLLHWNPNSETDLAKYYIYAGTAIYPTAIVDSTCGGLNDTLKTIAGLTNYQQYFFRVTAVDTNGNISGYSDQTGAIPTDTTKPSVPQNLVAVAGDEQIMIHWNPIANTDFAKYYIYLSLLGNSTVVYDSLTAVNDTIKVLTGLNNYSEYYVRITAVDTNGNISDYSVELTATPSDQTAPAAPASLTVVDSVASYFTIAWNMSLETDIAKYYIYRDSVPNPTTLVDSTVNVVDTVRAFTTLTIGQPYYFRVAAVDTSGNVGALSNQVSAVPYMVYPIFAYSFGNGALTPGGTNFVDHGDSLQFTIQADPLHHIDSIAIDPNIIMVEERAITGGGTDGSMMKRRMKTAAPLEQMNDPITLIGTGNDDTLRTYTFTNVTSSHTIKAYFSKNSYTITAAVSGNGTITPTDSAVVYHGDTIQFLITADQFYHTDSVLVDGVKTDSLCAYTFTDVTAPHTIAAYFSPNVFDHFIVEAPSRGPIDPQTAGASFLITVTAVDATGNPVDSFTGNVWFSSSDIMMSVLGENYSNPFIAGAHGPQQVTLFTAGMQTISVIDSVSGKGGTSDPFFVNAAGLHHFSVLDTSGSPVSDQVEGRMFPVKIVAMDNYNNVQSDYSGQVDVNIDDGESGVFFGATTNFIGGIFSPYFAQIDAAGSFSITVNDNMAEKGGGSNTFMVVSDTNFIYAVSTNGSISPFDSIAVQYGDPALFSFSPMPGYHFDSLMVDGVRIPDSTSHYTFFNVTGPHMIEVYNSVNLNIPPMFTVVLSDTAIARFDTLSFSYGVSDPDLGIIRYSIESGPAGAVIDSVTGVLTYIPAVNANGTYPLIVKAVDDSLAAIVDTVNIRVNIYGDVSGNGTISAYDGSLVLIQSVGGMVFTPLQEKIADVSVAPGVTAMDASYILQRAVGLISSFPGGLGKQERTEGVLSAFSFRIQKSEKQDEYDLFVSVNKASNTFGIVVSLGFDSSIVRPLGMSKTASTDSMSMAFKFPDGAANVALAGVTPMTSAGDIIKFTFRLKDPNYPKNAVLFTMKKFILNETDHSGDIGGITLNVRDLAQLPTVYKLEQNFPNPFNPSTTINYQLPDAGNVRIVIYNMLGQMVKTLVNEEHSAGYYSQLWNGTDDTDRKVASGVYIYRIEVTGAQNKRFTEVKKMIMIK